MKVLLNKIHLYPLQWEDSEYGEILYFDHYDDQETIRSGDGYSYCMYGITFLSGLGKGVRFVNEDFTED